MEIRAAILRQPLVAAGTFLLLSTGAMAQSLDVPSGTYKVDPTHASLRWKVNHIGLTDYVGRFNEMDATIMLDVEQPTESSVSVTIDPTSIWTGYPYPEKTDFDEELATGEKFFNSGKFGEISFKSTKLEMTSETQGKMTGDLTMLGVTKPVTLDVTLTGAIAEHPFAKKPALGFSATGMLKRSEWGMTYLVPMVADEVTVEINAEFIQE